MALINKITAIANAIRRKTGSNDPMTLDQMAIEIEELDVEMPQVFILEDDYGNELTAVRVGHDAIVNATADDIRAGKTAVTNDGIVEGTLIV